VHLWANGFDYGVLDGNRFNIPAIALRCSAGPRPFE
jgi:hypothetical protein